MFSSMPFVILFALVAGIVVYICGYIFYSKWIANHAVNPGATSPSAAPVTVEETEEFRKLMEENVNLSGTNPSAAPVTVEETEEFQQLLAENDQMIEEMDKEIASWRDPASNLNGYPLDEALATPEIPEQVFDLFPRDDKKYLKMSVRVVARALGYGGRHRSGWVRNQVITGLRRWGYKIKIDKRNPRLLLIQAK